MSYTLSKIALAFAAANGSTWNLPYLFTLQLFEQNGVFLHPHFNNALYSVNIKDYKVHKGSNQSPTRFRAYKVGVR